MVGAIRRRFLAGLADLYDRRGRLRIAGRVTMQDPRDVERAGLDADDATQIPLLSWRSAVVFRAVTPCRPGRPAEIFRVIGRLTLRPDTVAAFNYLKKSKNFRYAFASGSSRPITPE